MDTGTPAGGPDEVRQAITGELQLMDPRVRASRERAAQLLDPEFTEVGASGRRWTREETLAELAGHAGSSADGAHYEPSEITGVRLAPGLVHLTFEAVLGADDDVGDHPVGLVEERQREPSGRTAPQGPRLSKGGTFLQNPQHRTSIARPTSSRFGVPVFRRF